MTKLIKYLDPFDPFPSAIPSTFFNTIEKMFNDLDVYNPEHKQWSLSRGFPKGDVIIEDNRAIVEFTLAGYEKDQLSVCADGNKLIISAKKCEKDDAPRTRTRAAFKEEIAFNRDFDLSGTEVEYRNGILQIIVPKFTQEEKTL